jgi:hypothetical protein
LAHTAERVEDLFVAIQEAAARKELERLTNKVATVSKGKS